MTILAVDNNEQRLRCLMELLCKIFPNDRIEATCDPLMAGKFSYYNRVDLLFAALVMRPMNGYEMATFVRKKSPSIKAVIMAYETEFDGLINEKNENFKTLLFPISKEGIWDVKEQFAISV